MKKKRRNRGGQKGNQNARTHGFYASSLTPGETSRFLNILNQEQVERAYLKSIVNAGLQQASGTLPDPLYSRTNYCEVCKMIQACFSPSIPSVLAMAKEKIIVY